MKGTRLPVRKALLFGILCVLVIVFCVILYGCPKKIETVEEIRALLQGEKLIIHAAGEIEKDGVVYNYTNSLDALTHSYKEGNRIFEIDFRMSEDHKVVCLHDWEDLFWNDTYLIRNEDHQKLDSSWFDKGKMFGQFTPLTGDKLAEFMRKHKDVYVITDVKGTGLSKEFLPTLAESYPDLKYRFIIQTYSEKDIDVVEENGFPFYLFTGYVHGKEGLPELIQRANQSHHLVGVTFWAKWADEEAFYEAMKETGLPMYVHTVNDEQEIQRYLDMGIDAVYTDRVDLVK